MTDTRMAQQRRAMMHDEEPDWREEATWRGRELRRLRVRAGLSQEQLGQRVPLSRGHISRLESGLICQQNTMHWLPLLLKVVVEERIRWEASVTITPLPDAVG